MFNLYLKSLEIQGFKSFPTATRLAFEKPITAIVGPNGSGKSNISDAILWVMGEQSTKTLRGGKMEDVIFGGTQRRSQLGFAEVSLILDNSEGHISLDTTEVMLTRRYYRSGESEYYINQSLVRLKDVVDILMDTGLGREGYSVIGQGRISDILSTKSKDRREIFEEAAGISRYRHRKDESERKLQQAEDNLVRIGDIIGELEEHVEPLREQSEVAKKYLLLTAEQQGIQVSLWLRELETLKSRIEKNDADYAEATRKYDTSKIELDDSNIESDSLAEMTKDTDIEADRVRDLIQNTEVQSSEVDSRIAVLKTQLESNNSQIENLSTEIKNQDAHSDGVGDEITIEEDRLKEIADEKAKINQNIETLRNELQNIIDSSGVSTEKHSTLINQEQNLQAEHNDKRSEFTALASQAQEITDMETSVEKELAVAKEDFKEHEKDHKSLVKELDKSKEELTSLGNVLNGLTLKAENRAKKAKESGEKLERLTYELNTLKSTQNILQEMEKEFKGYSGSVKMVMQEFSRGALKNIHGTVGSLVKTEDEYTIAIETALGGALQNIVVDTVDDGKAAINYLKRRDGGRATFLPISTIKGTTLKDSDFNSDNGFVGIALNLVDFKDKYNGIYANLLGRVVIADSLNNATEIAKTHGHKYKIVTLDGQVMNVGGSMTGGSTVNTVGVLSRANELEQLEGKIKTCTEQHTKIQREHSEYLREKTAADYELSTALVELRTAEEDVLKQELETSHHEKLLLTLSGNIETLTAELKNIEERLKNNSKISETLKSELNDIEKNLTELKDEIEEAIIGQEKISVERERVNEALAEYRTKIAALEAESDSTTKLVAQLNTIRDDMYGSRERQLDTINKLKSENELILSDIQKNEHNILSIAEELNKHKETLTKLYKKKNEIEAKSNSLRKSLQDRNEVLHNLQRKCDNLLLKKNNLDNEERNIHDKLWDNYELSPTTAISAGTPIENINTAKSRLNAIKRELFELGEPNIGAIKEYERVSVRYNDLTTQREDVVKAKTDLLVIIEDITSHMRNIFTKEFANINKHFEVTFKELFGGGHASLELEDVDDVLNCGIEIKAQPPGKQLRTLSLLSGGEQAFVAIAIYFAILTVRPPPFVVMDEIDAALDDANVIRFADYMRFMSDKTQMVVISHKRGTMEEADVLYGITMQEHGVSNVICIDLNEAEKHIKKA